MLMKKIYLFIKHTFTLNYTLNFFELMILTQIFKPVFFDLSLKSER